MSEVRKDWLILVLHPLAFGGLFFVILMVFIGWLGIVGNANLNFDNWKEYYEMNYTPLQAIEEDLTYL